MERFNLSAWGVRNGALTLFAILLLALAGAGAYMRLGRAEDPSFTLKLMIVSASWPGATAEEMQAQVADRILLLARTTPLDQVKRKTDGLTLFYTKLDRANVEVRLIHKMGRHGVDSNMLFFDGLEVPEEDRIGAEGEGFRLILHGLNPERILVAGQTIELR